MAPMGVFFVAWDLMLGLLLLEEPPDVGVLSDSSLEVGVEVGASENVVSGS
jgi:hypothetical protein